MQFVQYHGLPARSPQSVAYTGYNPAAQFSIWVPDQHLQILPLKLLESRVPHFEELVVQEDHLHRLENLLQVLILVLEVLVVPQRRGRLTVVRSHRSLHKILRSLLRWRRPACWPPSRQSASLLQRAAPPPSKGPLSVRDGLGGTWSTRQVGTVYLNKTSTRRTKLWSFPHQMIR